MTTLDPDAAALLALKARQGTGARWDAPSAPAAALALARRGTAFYARKLSELTDEALAAPSLRPGAPRAALVAEIALQARALALMAGRARTGAAVPAPQPEAARMAEIALAATLPPRALRHLFDHSAIHLNVEWRDMDDAAWDAVLQGPEGAVPARDMPMIRARALWHGALALGNGARAADLPPEMRA